MRFRQSAPLPANPRMENLFERALLSGVLEDYGAKRLPIQVARAGKNLLAKFPDQLRFHFRKIDNFSRRHIGIEEFRSRHQLAQTIAKRTLTRGHSTRDSNGWHV